MELDFNLRGEIPNFDERIKQGDRFIPKKLFKLPGIKVNEVFYLSLYYNFDKDINKTDEEFKKLVSIPTMNKIKNKLIKLGYLDIKTNLSPSELKEFTIKNSHKGKRCEWCGKECYILHKHHYPIPRHLGGTESVNICPNCHYTFHKAMGGIDGK